MLEIDLRRGVTIVLYFTRGFRPSLFVTFGACLKPTRLYLTGVHAAIMLGRALVAGCLVGLASVAIAADLAGINPNDIPQCGVCDLWLSPQALRD